MSACLWVNCPSNGSPVLSARSRNSTACTSVMRSPEYGVLSSAISLLGGKMLVDMSLLFAELLAQPRNPLLGLLSVQVAVEPLVRAVGEIAQDHGLPVGHRILGMSFGGREPRGRCLPHDVGIFLSALAHDAVLLSSNAPATGPVP